VYTAIDARTPGRILSLASQGGSAAHMSIGTRLFFLDNEDRIHRISVRKFNRFYLQHDENESFPDFAGRRVRYALVFLELEDRKPAG
jgi:hypothetical protein